MELVDFSWNWWIFWTGGERARMLQGCSKDAPRMLQGCKPPRAGPPYEVTSLLRTKFNEDLTRRQARGPANNYACKVPPYVSLQKFIILPQKRFFRKNQNFVQIGCRRSHSKALDLHMNLGPLPKLKTIKIDFASRVPPRQPEAQVLIQNSIF